MRKIRRKTPKEQRRPIVAAVWYSNENQWQSMREISVDTDRFEDSYDSWLIMFEKSLKELVGAGLYPIKTPINVDEFKDWCESGSKPFNASSRSEFAASRLRQSDENSRVH